MKSKTQKDEGAQSSDEIRYFDVAKCPSCQKNHKGYWMDCHVDESGVAHLYCPNTGYCVATGKLEVCSQDSPNK